MAKVDTNSAVHLSGHEVAATLGVNVRQVYRLERVLREVGAIAAAALTQAVPMYAYSGRWS